ncbi:MAG: LytR C-terminal domain-containing protein [Candidatus Woesebacteria bacterium]|nr:LytR C-terminal domain-containing protein [Candidatus Woesebacteria bacterium]
MPNEEKSKRKRMVVEEVKSEETPKAEEASKKEEKAAEAVIEPKILDEAAKDTVSIEPQPESKKSPLIALWIIIPGIFLLGAILGGIVFYQRGVGSKEVANPTSTPSPASTPIPSASPSASVDLTKYTISIFNGSGIAGEAGKAKTMLVAAGFKVGSTANAATYDYTKTIIKAKTTVEASFVSALSAALGKSYIVDNPLKLASTSADSIQVVIGSSKSP